MEIKLNVKDEYLANVLCSGYEGGIRYWCSSGEIHDGPLTLEHAAKPEVADSFCGSDLAARYYGPLLDGHWLLTVDTGEDPERDGKQFKLDRGGIERAIQIIADKYPHHLAAATFDESQQDAVTGDVLIQCAIFGDIIYG